MRVRDPGEAGFSRGGPFWTFLCDLGWGVLDSFLRETKGVFQKAPGGSENPLGFSEKRARAGSVFFLVSRGGSPPMGEGGVLH